MEPAASWEGHEERAPAPAKLCYTAWRMPYPVSMILISPVLAHLWLAWLYTGSFPFGLLPEAQQPAFLALDGMYFGATGET